MCVLSLLYYVICGGGGEWEYKVTYVGRLVMSGIYTHVLLSVCVCCRLIWFITSDFCSQSQNNRLKLKTDICLWLNMQLSSLQSLESGKATQRMFAAMLQVGKMARELSTRPLA